jgi:PII-like signaling protein
MNEPCLKLTTYFGERQRVVTDHARRPGFLADATLDLFDTREVATSVMLRGIASFGLRHVLRTDESLSLSEDPPVTIAAVDVESKINDLVDEVVAMTSHGLVTLEPARLVRSDDLLDVGINDAVKLTVYVGRQERIGGRPHIAPCAICSTGTDSPVVQCFWASTARRTASATGPASSAETSTSR